MTLTIQQYHPDLKRVWNDFIDHSINGTFLLHRDFMDYHHDRFKDHSLLVFNEDALICCIPAHTVQDSIYSHRGLSYGGLILNKISAQNIDLVLELFVEYVKGHAFAKAELQPPPLSYNTINSEIAKYLKNYGFKINRVLHNQYVNLKEEVNVSPKKSIGYRNGKFDGLSIHKGSDFKSFWDFVLVPQLDSRHASKPVHNVEEIELLHSRFPEQIIQHNAWRDGELLAGITFFIKDKVVKSQYASSSLKGMKTDAVGFIYMEAMKEFKEKGFSIMDYGPVNERDGAINEGLLRFKKQLGCVEEEWKRWVIEL
ncbi:hypothetical protein [Nonlabens sp. Asnod2-A12]|uniref:hypothetical protein n=1 Tax=Nonlabens sp. Asnod2-A12 TaxID=3160578 RepID=UPI00386FECBD